MTEYNFYRDGHIDLKPCPFCGVMPNERISEDGSLHIIECTDSECLFKPRHIDYLRYKKMACVAWNTRAKAN